MAWLITRDHDFDRNARAFDMSKSDKGTASPGYTEEMRPKLTERFKMYDDDNLIYSGVATPGADFDPLDDFGEPNFGCTRIDYRNATTGVYETL